MSGTDIDGRFIRTKMLLGEENMEKLNKSHVTVFGAGGVGSYIIEALARSGIGNLTIIDSDTICETNINRQIHALTGTIGRLKTQVMAERVLEINPKINITAIAQFITAENAADAIPPCTTVVADAIDTVTAKLAVIASAKAMGKPIISSMGMANKLHPERIQLADISKTKVCPLAKVMRYELRQRGILGVTVCYSEETPVAPTVYEYSDTPATKRPLGSSAFVPAAAGLIIAGWIVRSICD